MENSSHRRSNVWVVWSIILLNIVGAVITKAAVDAGAIEANPVARFFLRLPSWGYYSLRIGIFTGGMLALLHYAREVTSLGIYFKIVLILSIVVCIHDSLVLLKLLN